ncbi:MAG: hypothetical protein IPK19_35190 [Chloroflexi bacterium]|nr:hypothetical protein [Chloroflexota bacterium]
MTTPTTSDIASQAVSFRLTGPWQVHPIPLDQCYDPSAPMPESISVQECTHLQLALYPEQPYWGDALRRINEQAWVYRRKFTMPKGDFKRARLRFEGVDYYAQVWLDEAYLGEHEGHFAPFEFDITPHLDKDTVTLTVRVTSPWDPPNATGTYPTDHVVRGLVKGLYEHGEGVIPPNVNPIGIWRPVCLLLDQGVSIDHVRIRTDLNGRTAVQLRVTNATPDAWQGALDLRVEAENHDGPGAHLRLETTVLPGTHTLDEIIQVPDPHLWWSWDQGSPDLYRLDASLMDAGGAVFASSRHVFGIRSVRLSRTPRRFTFWLNNRPVFIRGTSYMPSMYLSECTPETLSRDVALARDAHLNLLRVHVHVSPPELYDLCDRKGMLVWQDFELNWIQDPSLEFEQRARSMQRQMVEMLQNHPAIMAWASHNEPTMVMVRRHNLERRPDPALYADLQTLDPTRPAFICSGQMEGDWRRSGDAHSYYGAFWTSRYTDICGHHFLLNSEFGFEAPAAADTLRRYPEVWERLKHLDGKIDDLWTYQAALIQFQVEYFRRMRPEGCAGYVHFWLTDLVPQVGCGVLDSNRLAKGGYDALRRASQPLHVALEHDGRRPIAVWVMNDTQRSYERAVVHWQIHSRSGELLADGKTQIAVRANETQRVPGAHWTLDPATCGRITLTLSQAGGELLSVNSYESPFAPLSRPTGYPWKFDPFLGTKVFDRPDAPSLADQSQSGLVRRIPLRVREAAAEWAMRQHLPNQVTTWIARLADTMMSLG